jgi:hypothetical protein
MRIKKKLTKAGAKRLARLHKAGCRIFHYYESGIYVFQCLTPADNSAEVESFSYFYINVSRLGEWFKIDEAMSDHLKGTGVFMVKPKEDWADLWRNYIGEHASSNK